MEESQTGGKAPKKTYALLAFERAMAEGRLVIDKRDGKDHRRFSLTLRPTQIVKALKDCLNKDEMSDVKDKELLLLTKKLIDYLIKQDNFNSDIFYRHFRGRLESFYRDRTRKRRKDI